MTAPTDIVITAARRTAMGGFQGDFRDVTAPELGAAALKAAVADSRLGSADVEQVVMGCVLPAGQGQAPARQAALKAGLDLGTAAVTLNKMCGSGMKAVMDAHDALKAGRPLSAAQGPRRLSDGPWPGDGPHVPRRPRRRL
jgi:acetyl-CoA C-acetyltransferase